jgi:hypothetical protein
MPLGRIERVCTALRTFARTVHTESNEEAENKPRTTYVTTLGILIKK